MKRVIFILTAVVAFSLAVQGGVVRLAILSDVHVTPGNANEGQLREAVAEINATDVDAVMMTGDLTNEGSDEQLTNVKGILDGISHPLYVIPGNHENNWSQSACKTFNDLWGSDRFVFTVDQLVVRYARNGLQVGLRYDIQCHDVDEYLVYLFDGLLTERPLELLEVVTIDGDLPLEFLFHISLCKVN